MFYSIRNLEVEPCDGGSGGDARVSGVVQQRPQRSNGAMIAAFAVMCGALLVVQHLVPIHTHGDGKSMRPQEVAVTVIQQSSVRGNRERDPSSVRFCALCRV